MSTSTNQFKGIFVEIGGTMQPLKEMLDRARGETRQAATDIANAFGGALSLNQVKSGFNTLHENLARLRGAANFKMEGLEKLAVDLKEVQKVTGVSEQSLRKLQQAMLQTSGQAAAARAFQDLQRQTGLTTRELAELGIKAQEMPKHMQRAQSAAKNAGAGFADLGRMANMLGVAFTGAGLGFAIKEFGTAVFEAGVQAQTLERAFNAIQGSSQAAGAEFQFLRRTADELGANFWDLAEGYKSISASARNTVMEGAPLHHLFTSLTGAMTVLGQSSYETQAVLRAFSQVISKGKLTAEELRQQLGERLYGAFQMAAEAAGVTTAELDALLRKGEVGLDVLISLADVLDERYGTAAKKAAKETNNAQAALNKLAEAWTDFKVSFSDTESVVWAIRQVTESLKDWAFWLSKGKSNPLQLLEEQIAQATDRIDQLRHHIKAGKEGGLLEGILWGGDAQAKMAAGLKLLEEYRKELLDKYEDMRTGGRNKNEDDKEFADFQRQGLIEASQWDLGDLVNQGIEALSGAEQKAQEKAVQDAEKAAEDRRAVYQRLAEDIATYDLTGYEKQVRDLDELAARHQGAADIQALVAQRREQLWKDASGEIIGLYEEEVQKAAEAGREYLKDQEETARKAAESRTGAHKWYLDQVAQMTDDDQAKGELEYAAYVEELNKHDLDRYEKQRLMALKWKETHKGILSDLLKEYGDWAGHVRDAIRSALSATANAGSDFLFDWLTDNTVADANLRDLESALADYDKAVKEAAGDEEKLKDAVKDLAAKYPDLVGQYESVKTAMDNISQRRADFVDKFKDEAEGVPSLGTAWEKVKESILRSFSDMTTQMLIKWAASGLESIFSWMVEGLDSAGAGSWLKDIKNWLFGDDSGPAEPLAAVGVAATDSGNAFRNDLIPATNEAAAALRGLAGAAGNGGGLSGIDYSTGQVGSAAAQASLDADWAGINADIDAATATMSRGLDTFGGILAALNDAGSLVETFGTFHWGDQFSYNWDKTGYGFRGDGTSKGFGWLGELSRPDGGVSTELSMRVSIDGQDIDLPALVPSLSENEINNLLNDGGITDQIAKKAIEHAMGRISEGLSPFYEGPDVRFDLDSFERSRNYNPLRYAAGDEELWSRLQGNASQDSNNIAEAWDTAKPYLAGLASAFSIYQGISSIGDNPVGGGLQAAGGAHGLYANPAVREALGLGTMSSLGAGIGGALGAAGGLWGLYSNIKSMTQGGLTPENLMGTLASAYSTYQGGTALAEAISAAMGQSAGQIAGQAAATAGAETGAQIAADISAGIAANAGQQAVGQIPGMTMTAGTAATGIGIVIAAIQAVGQIALANREHMTPETAREELETYITDLKRQGAGFGASDDLGYLNSGYPNRRAAIMNAYAQFSGTDAEEFKAMLESAGVAWDDFQARVMDFNIADAFKKSAQDLGRGTETGGDLAEAARKLAQVWGIDLEDALNEVWSHSLAAPFANNSTEYEKALNMLQAGVTDLGQSATNASIQMGDVVYSLHQISDAGYGTADSIQSLGAAFNAEANAAFQATEIGNGLYTMTMQLGETSLQTTTSLDMFKEGVGFAAEAMLNAGDAAFGLGELINGLPSEKTINVVTRYTTTGAPPSEVPLGGDGESAGDVPAFHTGGPVPAWMASLPAYHGGGEVLARLLPGEDVWSRADIARHGGMGAVEALRRGGQEGQARQGDTTTINVNIAGNKRDGAAIGKKVVQTVKDRLVNQRVFV